MIEVVNRQRKMPMDGGRWRAFGERALKVVPADGAGATVAFVSDRAMRELNRKWRGKRGTTDVLSFPQHGASIGDVVISLQRARRQAREGGWPLAAELRRLLAHGLLHCLGHGHQNRAAARRMASAERRLLGHDGLVGDSLSSR